MGMDITENAPACDLNNADIKSAQYCPKEYFAVRSFHFMTLQYITEQYSFNGLTAV
jgi:hypothetical protein